MATRRYTAEEINDAFAEIMAECGTLSRHEEWTLLQLLQSTWESLDREEGPNAARKIDRARAVLDFLFEARRIPNEAFVRLHDLTARVMGYYTADKAG